MNNKKNILLIITDQQNIDTISAYKEYFKDKSSGVHYLNTPNLDKLVSGGYSFLLSHSANPVSCPARASIFTGRYSIENGVVFNNIGIDKNVKNLGEWLSVHGGYNCFYSGKWHAGGKWNYPAVSGNRKIPGFETIPIGEFPTGEHNDYQVSTAVRNFLDGYDSSNPFFIVAGLMNPHDICYWTMKDRELTSSDELLDEKLDYPSLPPNNSYSFKEPKRLAQTRRVANSTYWLNYSYDYYRMVEKVDLDIGRILNAVERRKDDTIVIFTSDHGEGLGRHSRVQKWHPYDQSVKVPLIFYSPGYINHSIDTNHLVSGIDLFSTICDFAGVSVLPTGIRGASLKNLMTRGADEKFDEREFIVSEFMITGRVVRSKRYKYVKMYEYSGDNENPFVKMDGTASKFTPTDRASEIYKSDPTVLLFDMIKDPWEMNNIAGDMIDIVEKHESYLREWEKMIVPGIHYDRN